MNRECLVRAQVLCDPLHSTFISPFPPLAPNFLAILCFLQFPRLDMLFHTSLLLHMLFHLPGMPRNGKEKSYSLFPANSYSSIETLAKLCLPWEIFYSFLQSWCSPAPGAQLLGADLPLGADTQLHPGSDAQGLATQ